MTVFFDLVRVYCTTAGSGGPLALGGAVTFGGTAKAFRSFADAGIPDGAALSWAIEDLGVPGREAGTGVYSAGAGTLTRNTTSSTSGNNPLALSGQAQLYVTALAADLVNASNIASGTLAEARIAQLDLTAPGNANGTVIQRLYTGTADPGTSNDSTQGYAAGSFGLNTSTGRAFVCRSAAASAAVWIAVALMEMPSYVAGNWVALSSMGATGGANGGQTGWVKFSPFILRERCTISGLSINITTGSAGGNVQLALYSADSTLLPTNLIDHTGSLSTTNTGAVSGALGANQQVEAGLYWAASQIDNMTAQYTTTHCAINSAVSLLFLAIGNPSLSSLFNGGNQNIGFIYANSFGTWPTPIVHGNMAAWGNGSDIPTMAADINSVP
jgi:hypothetical protein